MYYIYILYIILVPEKLKPDWFVALKTWEWPGDEASANVPVYMLHAVVPLLLQLNLCGGWHTGFHSLNYNWHNNMQGSYSG